MLLIGIEYFRYFSYNYKILVIFLGETPKENLKNYKKIPKECAYSRRSASCNKKILKFIIHENIKSKIRNTIGEHNMQISLGLN